MTTAADARPNPLLDAVGNILRDMRKETAERLGALETEVSVLRGRALRAAAVAATDDPRAYVLRLTLADGQAIECSFQVPVPLHRGKWDAEHTYSFNDMVAWRGGSWIARRDTKGEEPGAGDAWYLATQKGKKGESEDVRATADRLDDLEDDADRLEAEMARLAVVEDRLDALEYELLALRAEFQKEE